MNLFEAITTIKKDKLLSRALITNGVISSVIFTEYDINSKVLKAVSYGQSKTLAVKETAQLLELSERYVWKCLKKFAIDKK